jgi:hypothetical protein
MYREQASWLRRRGVLAVSEAAAAWAITGFASRAQAGALLRALLAR